MVRKSIDSGDYIIADLSNGNVHQVSKVGNAIKFSTQQLLGTLRFTNVYEYGHKL